MLSVFLSFDDRKRGYHMSHRGNGRTDLDLFEWISVMNTQDPSFASYVMSESRWKILTSVLPTDNWRELRVDSEGQEVGGLERLKEFGCVCHLCLMCYLTHYTTGERYRDLEDRKSTVYSTTDSICNSSFQLWHFQSLPRSTSSVDDLLPLSSFCFTGRWRLHYIRRWKQHVVGVWYSEQGLDQIIAVKQRGENNMSH